MTVDTIPPALRLVSQLNYVNKGGTGLIIYQTTSDAVKSGLYVEKRFFPGYPSGRSPDDQALWPRPGRSPDHPASLGCASLRAPGGACRELAGPC